MGRRRRARRRGTVRGIGRHVERDGHPFLFAERRMDRGHGAQRGFGIGRQPVQLLDGQIGPLGFPGPGLGVRIADHLSIASGGGGRVVATRRPSTAWIRTSARGEPVDPRFPPEGPAQLGPRLIRCQQPVSRRRARQHRVRERAAAARSLDRAQPQRPARSSRTGPASPDRPADGRRTPSARDGRGAGTRASCTSRGRGEPRTHA